MAIAISEVQGTIAVALAWHVFAARAKAPKLFSVLRVKCVDARQDKPRTRGPVSPAIALMTWEKAKPVSPGPRRRGHPRRSDFPRRRCRHGRAIAVFPSRRRARRRIPRPIRQRR